MRSIAWLTCIIVSASLASGQALLTAYRAQAAPVIDGVLDDPCWQAASVASRFLSATAARTLPGEQTHVQVAWDDANLYVGVTAFEALLEPRLNMLHKVTADKTGRDANVFSDDCVELFLQPTDAAYYHFAANSGTGTYEGMGGGNSWDCDWQCVAKRGNRSYILEMSIPFAALGAKPEGNWTVNFTRTRPQAKEYSTWSGLQGAFHQPQSFGALRFADTGPALKATGVACGEDACEFTTTLAGAADEASVFEGLVSAGDATTVGRATGPGAHRVSASLPDAAHTAGRYTVSYALRQGDEILLRSAALEEVVAAGVVALNLSTSNATARVTLNGTEVSLTDGATVLHLADGMNMLAILADATGEAPRALPALVMTGRPLSVSWLARGDEPDEGWQTSLQTQGWGPANADAKGLWATGAGEKAWLWAALFVGKPRPQLFPKSSVFYIPRGSRQLMRLYVHTAAEVPGEDYRMVVEVPEGLTFVAADPITGGAPPAVTPAESFDDDGTPMSRYNVAYDLMPGQGMELSMRWGDTSGATLAYQPTIAGGGTFDWRHMSMTLKVPRGAVSAHPLVIKWQNRGITGTFWVDNIVFREKDSDENLLTMGTFDEPGWGKHYMLKPEGPDGSTCLRIVSTPELADRQQAMWVDKEGVVPVDPGKEYVIEFDLKCEKLASPSAKPLTGLLFEAPADMPEGETPLYTYFQSLDGAVTELPQKSTVRILPALKNVRPARARICPCYYGSTFSNPQVAEAYAENCWASGITWTYGKMSNNVVPHLLERGHRVFLSIGWEPWRLPSGARDFLKEHPALAAVDFKGKPSPNIVCPTWMLAEGDVVMKALEDWLLAVVNSEPYYGANWDIEQPVIDPPTFCICPRCLAAFRAFAGLANDVELSAETILKTYPEQWTDFRCTQNAEMAGHIKAILRKADRPIEFSLYSGYQSRRTKEHYGVDWKLMAPHLDFAIAGYNGAREVLEDTIEALGDTPFMGGEMWYLSDKSDAQPTPRYETWRNRILRQYVHSGCKGCLIWWLPPMDGGAFYATSEAAEIIAKHEDFFKAEQRCDEKVTVEGLGLSDWAAFEKDGRILVLLMNFRDELLPVTVKAGGETKGVQIKPYGVSVVVTR